MRQPTTTRRIVGITVAVLAALTVWLVGPVLAVELDEGAVPAVSKLDLPAGMQIIEQTENCGSGGCWHELLIAWPGHTSDQLRAGLLIGGDPTRDRCEPVSLIDRRKVCIFEVVLGKPPPDGQVLISERWNRPLGL